MGTVIDAPIGKEDNSKYKSETEMLSYDREFLNKDNHGGLAAIKAYVEANKEFKDDKLDSIYISTSFTVTDCERKISLEFSANGENYDNSIYKINKLIDTLNNFKQGLIKGRKMKVQLEKKRQKKLNKPSN